MDGNLEEIRARARLLLAADKWRDLTQLLKKDVRIRHIERQPTFTSTCRSGRWHSGPRPRHRPPH